MTMMTITNQVNLVLTSQPTANSKNLTVALSASLNYFDTS